jgi:hypothetical protein
VAESFSNLGVGRTISSVLQKHGRSGSQSPSCDSVADSSVALVALEAFRPLDILAVPPEMVVLSGTAVPIEIADSFGSEHAAERYSLAVVVTGHRTVFRRRMANRPALPGHHQNMHPLRDLPGD